MPWVAACLDLLAGPILGYCVAVRKLALQAGIMQEGDSVIVDNRKDSTTMAPAVEDKIEGRRLISIGVCVSVLSLLAQSHIVLGVEIK